MRVLSVDTIAAEGIAYLRDHGVQVAGAAIDVWSEEPRAASASGGSSSTRASS